MQRYVCSLYAHTHTHTHIYIYIYHRLLHIIHSVKPTHPLHLTFTALTTFAFWFSLVVSGPQPHRPVGTAPLSQLHVAENHDMFIRACRSLGVPSSVVPSQQGDKEKPFGLCPLEWAGLSCPRGLGLRVWRRWRSKRNKRDIDRKRKRNRLSWSILYLVLLTAYSPNTIFNEGHTDSSDIDVHVSTYSIYW